MNINNLIKQGSYLRDLSEISSWLSEVSKNSDFSVGIDSSFVSGFYAPCVGYAFSAGYQNAIADLFHADSKTLSSFSMTEGGSSHPGKIQTTIDLNANELNGTKGFVALASDVRRLYVLAKVIGSKNDELDSSFKIVSVSRHRKGIEISATPSTFLMPEVTHGSVNFDSVKIDAEDITFGDAYEDYVNPFRTWEDLHVVSALLGYLYSMVFRENLGLDISIQVTEILSGLHEIVFWGGNNPQGHLKLDRIMHKFIGLVLEIECAWQGKNSKAYRDWLRDKVLLKMSQKARDRRTEMALMSVNAA